MWAVGLEFSHWVYLLAFSCLQNKFAKLSPCWCNTIQCETWNFSFKGRVSSRVKHVKVTVGDRQREEDKSNYLEKGSPYTWHQKLRILDDNNSNITKIAPHSQKGRKLKAFLFSFLFVVFVGREKSSQMRFRNRDYSWRIQVQSTWSRVPCKGQRRRWANVVSWNHACLGWYTSSILDTAQLKRVLTLTLPLWYPCHTHISHTSQQGNKYMCKGWTSQPQQR